MITEYSMTFFRPLELVESILLVLLYKTENIVVVCGVSLQFSVFEMPSCFNRGMIT
jgi:hypothetical protein